MRSHSIFDGHKTQNRGEAAEWQTSRMEVRENPRIFFGWIFPTDENIWRLRQAAKSFHGNPLGNTAHRL